MKSFLTKYILPDENICLYKYTKDAVGWLVGYVKPWWLIKCWSQSFFQAIIWFQVTIPIWLGGVLTVKWFKAMDYGIVVSKFEFQSRYYVHFRTNTLGKGMNPLYPPSYGLNSTTIVLLEGWLWH